MHKLMEVVCNELEDLERKVAKEGKLSRTDFEDAKNLTEVKKNILKIEMLSGDSEYSNAMGGYSRRGGYSMRGSYADGRSYMDGSYADGGYSSDGNYVRPDGSYRREIVDSSYARGRGAGAKRDSMGRYSRSSDQTIQEVRMLLNRTTDEQARQELSKLVDRLESM